MCIRDRYDTVGFTLNFILSAAMMFVSALIVWAWINDRKTTAEPMVKSDLELGEGVGDLPMLKMLILTNSLSMFGINGLRQLMMIYMGSGLGFSGTLIGTVSAIGSVTNLVLGVPVGYVSDKVDKRKLYLAALAVNAASPAMLLYWRPLSISLSFLLWWACLGRCLRLRRFLWLESSHLPTTEGNSWGTSTLSDTYSGSGYLLFSWEAIWQTTSGTYIRHRAHLRQKL